MPLSKYLVCSFTLLSAFVPAVFGQSTAARVSGSITDATKGVVPGATAVATSPATGWTTRSASNAEGRYTLYPLPPGVYNISFEKSGFQSVRVEQILLHANDDVVRNVQLPVGSVSQEVTVSATAPVVSQTISTESTVTEEQVQTLPLNGRDYNNLVFLGAGTVDPKVTGANPDLGSVAVNGNRSYSNSYSIDGVSNDSRMQNNTAIALSVDLIREFKVISGVAPAEYGQGGVNVVAISKSGTNRLSGSLYEYYRGNTLIARDPFVMQEPAPFSRHQFGAAAGGPVRLPKYDGRNRTFFFVNYEGLRQAGGATRVATVPLDQYWKGDFSSLLPRIQLRDPRITGRPNIPGNRLDTYLGGTRIDPIALQLRPLFAPPNLPGIVNNSARQVDALTDTDQYTTKVDHLLPYNQSLSARWTYSSSRVYTPGAMGLPGVGIKNKTTSWNAMLGWTVPLGTSIVNELKAGMTSYYPNWEYPYGSMPTAESVGMQGFIPKGSAIPPSPVINFSGIDAFGVMSYNNGTAQNLVSYSQNIFNYTEAISIYRGKHQIKAGMAGRKTGLNIMNTNNGNGSVSFLGSATSAASSGYSFADFMMGLPYSSQETPLRAKVNFTQPEYAFFVQDDWRATRNLTVTVGVRDEVYFQPAEERNRLAMFSPEIPGGGMVVACSDGKLPVREFLPVVAARLTDASGKYAFPIVCGSTLGYDERSLARDRPANWSPRVGLAWDPFGSGKWLVRSGYGIFYTRNPLLYFSQQAGSNPPFAASFNYAQTMANGVPTLTLRSPLLSTGSPAVAPSGLPKNFLLPDNQQWNFTLQRALGRDSTISVAYLGNKGTHLFHGLNFNTARIDPATNKLIRLYQTTFGTSNTVLQMSDANSSYHAMQTELRRRHAKGLSYQLNWTWAKGLDNVGAYANSNILDVENLGRDRANSDYVRRHQANGNFTWEMPVGRRKRFGSQFPGWLDAGLGGWRLSGMWRYTTGRYLTPSYTNSFGFSASNRPDVVYGVSPDLPRGERGQARWFNPKAFSIPPQIDPEIGKTRFGNAGRNIVAGPGMNLCDASLSKSFRAGERRSVILRMDMFNVLNHANWANPDMNISNVNTVGVISAINGTMRQAQFAVQYQF